MGITAGCCHMTETNPDPGAALPANRPGEGLERIKALVLDSVASAHSKRAYGQALDDFFAWYGAACRTAFSKAAVQQYRVNLEQRGLAASSINVRLAAVRKLAWEAADNGLLAPELAAGIARVKGAKRLGIRAGNWLTREQAQELLDTPDWSTLQGKRDRAILALLIGCGLRRAELVRLDCHDIQQRDGRWVIADLRGKGNHLRTVPVPAWVKSLIDDWTAAAGIAGGRLFRPINKSGRMWGESISEKVVWWVVSGYARAIGIPNLAPHDLRRTCAKLCRASSGDLEQIQFLLGHASIQTTERYLGSRQNLRFAVNDHLGIDAAPL